MPYIITTIPAEWAGYASQNGTADAFERSQTGLGPAASRRAVGTLDEAIAACERAGADWQALIPLDEDGGTIGPLPDGTVVEVEPFEWSQLARSCSPPLPIQGTPGDRWTDAEKTEIVDTYNAAQED